MNLSIRTKLIGTLVFATILPLVLALFTLFTAGYRHQVYQKGVTYHSEALHVAHSLSVIAGQKVSDLNDLLSLTRMRELMLEAKSGNGPESDPEFKLHVDKLEASWPVLAPDSPEIGAIIGNDMANQLRLFQHEHPLFAEMLLTDAHGRLIAATQKTSDYFQADEVWWQEAAQLRPGEAWVEGLAFDESAQVFSLDVSIPIRPIPGDRAHELIGIVKGVLNVSPLFASVPYLLSDREVIRQIVLDDGRVLLRLLDNEFVPRSETLGRGVIDELKSNPNGWQVVRMGEGRKHMAGVAPLRLFGVITPDATRTRTGDMYVLVISTADTVLAPIRNQMFIIAIIGSIMVICIAVLGILISGSFIIRPLEVLRDAARSVANTARTHGTTAREVADRRSAAHRVQCVRKIKTGDEIQQLSTDFVEMAEKLLSYQENLEADVATKTAEIQSDLAMARDFQQALLPSSYPLIPTGAGEDRFSLEFHHIYRPTTALSGDFFDVIKLDDHRAGIITADVMGHGTRSALITAILRTLLYEVAHKTDDPGEFLSRLNRAFYDIIQQTGEIVFVTAAYMVIDTAKATGKCASAGHLSPLLANRRTGSVELLFPKLENSPALGLFPESEHSVFTWDLNNYETAFMYTDGVTEALNKQDQEFGTHRLIQSIVKNLDQDAAAILQSVLKDVARFTGDKSIEDDICLIAMEAHRTGYDKPDREAPVHEASGAV